MGTYVTGPTVCDPHTSTTIKKIDSVQSRSVCVTLNHYERTLCLKNWTDNHLKKEAKLLKLATFYKTCYQLVHINMCLHSKQYTMPMEHQQLRSVTAPLNRFYVLWRHRNYHCIIIIIIIIIIMGTKNAFAHNILASSCDYYLQFSLS